MFIPENEPEEHLVPPTFTRHLLPSNALEGSLLELHCTVEGQPLPTVQWFKRDICIDNTPDYNITFNNGEAILRFDELFLDDQAEYTCQATNPAGSASTTASITVQRNFFLINKII